MTDIESQTNDVLMAGLDRIDQGISLFDGELRLVFANQRFCDLLDLPRALAQPGASFESLIRWNAERGEYGSGDLDKLVADRVGKARRFEVHTLERVRPDGTVLNVSGWPLPGGGFATVYTDITVQRRREIELERRLLQQSEELRQSEQRLRQVANEVPAGIAYLDQSGTFRFVNRRFARSHAMKSEDMVGRRHREVLGAVVMDRAQPFFDRAAKGEALAFDMPMSFPDGRTLETRTLLRPDREPSGAVSGFYVLTVNVTREKTAAAALLQAQKMETLGQLSSGIAHDFNNLLTVILGNLRPLERHVPDETVRRDMLEPAIRATRRGAELMRRLLSVARRQIVSPAAVDLVDTARTIIELVRPSITQDTRFVAEFGPTPPAFVDPAMLESCLLNLTVNAVDATCGHGTVRFRTGISENGSPFIEIEDDGVGMKPETGARIYEPFFSTKQTGGRTGLGLTMVKDFVDASGGTLTVETSFGDGTTFRLLLPRSQTVPQATKRSDLDQRTRAVFAGRMVLLVDDEDDVRHVIRRDLVDAGAQVIEASDGMEAVELHRTIADIDLVISDVAMPRLDGVQLVHELRSADPDLPILLLTGYGLEGLAAQLPADVPALNKPADLASMATAFLQTAEATTRMERTR